MNNNKMNFTASDFPYYHFLIERAQHNSNSSLKKA